MGGLFLGIDGGGDEFRSRRIRRQGIGIFQRSVLARAGRFSRVFVSVQYPAAASQRRRAAKVMRAPQRQAGGSYWRRMW
jgi:hypothetical protein